MGVLNAEGTPFKPFVEFAGKQHHYKRLQGRTEGTLTDFPPCYLYKRYPAGVDALIFADWTHEFLEEVKVYRLPGQNIFTDL